MDPEAGQGMERNDEAREALPDIFGIPVILNTILEQLPNSKLLELSFVSKLWKKEARIVMKKRGNIMALLKCDGVSGCGKNFEAFAANLETLKETLYSGMTIWLRPAVDCQGTGSLEVERIHESILAGMRGKLKRLSIRLYHPGVCWNSARDCPNFLLLRFLLRDFIGELEHLTIEIQKIMEPFIQEFLPHGPYPKLKVLKLNDHFTSDEETFGNQIRMLLPRAPNLQEIHSAGRVSLRENLMEGREGVVRIHERKEPQLNLGEFDKQARILLIRTRTTSCSRSSYLDLQEVSLVLMMSHRTRFVPLRSLLERVSKLTIGLDYVELEQFEPRIISILSRFDLNLLLPSLVLVDIHMNKGSLNLGELSWDTMDEIIGQASAVPMEPTCPRAGNIKELYLVCPTSIPTSAVQFFAQMFPAIEKLSVLRGDEVLPVESAWEHWPNLKWINVGYPRYLFRSV